MMKKTLGILTLCLLSFVSLRSAQAAKHALLLDGIVLRGAVGKLIGPDSNDVCFFELSSPIDDNNLNLEAGIKFELLPSSALEMMIADVNTHASAIYQLWNAKVTRYKGKNYIFPSIFIRFNPPSETQETKETAEAAPTQPAEIAGPNSEPIDANGSLVLPPEVLERLNAAREETSKTGRRITDSNIVTIDTIQQELERKRQANPDTVLLDKYAVLVERKNGVYEFSLDSIGRNINQTSFRLLPCEALEQTELRQAKSPEPLRFKISGTVTKYRGENYLLLYKATRVYSHGNFPD
jgi:hypothetical protein